MMTSAEVARQGYAALKAGRPQIITGPVNRIIAMSTRFTPMAILLMDCWSSKPPRKGADMSSWCRKRTSFSAIVMSA